MLAAVPAGELPCGPLAFFMVPRDRTATRRVNSIPLFLARPQNPLGFLSSPGDLLLPLLGRSKLVRALLFGMTQVICESLQGLNAGIRGTADLDGL